MRIWIITCLALTAVLAGCSDDESSPGDDGGEDLFDEKPRATSTTGVIRGVVLDETITPLAGAVISITGSDHETTSNDKGAFAFSGLEEGSHILSVSKAGYEATQTSTLVVAGVDDPPILKVQLVRAPGTEPFIIPHDHNGRLDCSFKLAIPGVGHLGGNMCHELEVDGTTVLPSVIGRMPLDETPEFLQSELNWESTQQFGEGLDWMYSWECNSNGGFLCDHSASGTSPVVNRLNSSQIDSGRFEGTPFGPDRDVLLRVFSDTSPTAADLFGVTIQQKFQAFTFAFYNIVPDEDYVYSTDGAYPLPP